MDILPPEILNFLQKKETFLEIDKIPGEASTRTYYRIRYKGSNRILCIDEKLDGYEYPFLLVRDFLSKNDFLVPEIMDIDLRHHCILQSDVGNRDLTFLDMIEYENYLKIALDEILRLQELQPIPIIEARTFDFAKLSFEINHTFSALDRFIEKNNKFPSADSGIKNFFLDCINYLASYNSKVICHRDFHARNIIIDEHGKSYWIDFQDMMMGTPQYDLVSILFDAYKPLSLEQRERFYNYFKENSKHKERKFRENFLMQAMQRSFKALGTYFVMYHDKGKNKYKDSILPCIQNIIEITQIGKFPDNLYLYFKDFQMHWKDFLNSVD